MTVVRVVTKVSPEDEKYYENYFDLFLTDGWKQFIEDLQETANSFDVRNIPDEATLKYTQGQLMILDRMLNFSNSIRTVYEDLQNDA